MAYKNCTSNGVWYINEQTGKHWTDYRECTPDKKEDDRDEWQKATMMKLKVLYCLITNY